MLDQEQRRDARRPDSAQRIQPEKIGSASRIKARLTISVWRAIFGSDSHSKVSAKTMFTFEKS